MAISEAQFAKMLKGTMHEGKYGDCPAPAQNKVPISINVGGTKHQEDMAKNVNRAIQVGALVYIFTTPFTWIIILLAITPFFIVLEPIMDLFEAYPILWFVPPVCAPIGGIIYANYLRNKRVNNYLRDRRRR